MSVQSDIKELILSFFDTINSDVSCDKGIYDISIPEKYHNHFRSQRISITFEKDIAADHHNCELVIVGSRILSTVIKICQSQGPVSLKKTQSDSGQTVMRYHFFVNFSGIHSMSDVTHVDIDLDSCKPVHAVCVLENNNVLPDVYFDSKNITQSYMAALEELEKKYNSEKTKFINDANAKFQDEFESFVGKYNTQMRDIDDAINKKDSNYDDLAKTNKIRFEGVDRIRELEDEKTRLAETLQQKHQISLTHNLIACEIISI